MRKFISIYFFLVLLFNLIRSSSYGQQLPLKTFSLAANSFVTTQVDGMQVDWRLDLGLTAIPLDGSTLYQFSAGFLQPSINRFANDAFWEKYNPSIEIKNTTNKDVMLLFSKEPDLILHGYNILNLHGQVILSDPTKYRSSYLGRSINVNAITSGVYIMQVFYLPEYLTFDNQTNYWMKYLKFIKP